jgi:exopolyphosphatase/guanosine-5'-triphosphate,3'-diphosphate pyrophosphatase
VKEEWWSDAEEWVSKLMKEEDNVVAIGTGGNINKIHKEAGKKSFAVIKPKEIKAVINYMSKFSFEERVYKLKLKPDRADVILPAAEIYMNMMKFAGIKEMIVPKVGLSDGIILWLYKRWKRSQKATAEG